MSWRYQGKEVTSAPPDAIGMVYRITRYPSESYIKLIEKGVGMSLPGATKVYIGKKLLHSTRKKAIGKRAQAKQLEECGDKRRVKKVERVTKDSGWMEYNSSNKQLASEIKENPELFHKEILHWTFSKKNTSYMEIVEMIRHRVLETDSYNDNISGTYYRHDTSKELYEQYREQQKQKKNDKERNNIR